MEDLEAGGSSSRLLWSLLGQVRLARRLELMEPPLPAPGQEHYASAAFEAFVPCRLGVLGERACGSLGE